MALHLLVLFLLATTVAVRAGDYTYITNSDNTLTITSYIGPGSDVVIPAIIEGRTVTIVGGFGGSTLNPQRRLTSVTIPDSVTHIETTAFYNCDVLTNAMLGTSITSIGGEAFKYCSSLVNINLPDSLISIGDGAFWYCVSLDSIIIPTGVTNIGRSAFLWCRSLTDVIIPNGHIGTFAFTYCGGLTNVTIGAGVTSMGDNLFRWCPSLTTILVDAGNSAYSSVAGVLFNKNQTVLITYPAGKAGSYTIPSSIISVAKDAFEFCSNLTDVTIPNSVTSIGSYAFVSCYRLMGVYFTGNAPSIGEYVFSGDDLATIYYLPGTMGWGWTFGGRPAMPWWDGPQISANGTREDVTLNRGEAVQITVALDAGNYEGIRVDCGSLLVPDQPGLT